MPKKTSETKTHRRPGRPRANPLPAPEIASVPPVVDQVSEEEVDRVRVVEAERSRDVFVPVNPNYELRPCAANDKRQAYWRARGYVPAKPHQVAEHSGYEGSDGMIHFGDRILMITPKELAQERRSRRRAQDRDLDKAMNERIEDAARDGQEGDGFHRYPEHSKERRGRRVFNIPLG